MFEYSGECVDGVNTDYLDIILSNEGIAGMWLKDGRIMYGTPTVSGLMGSRYTYEGTAGTVLNVFNPEVSIQGIEGIDFIYMFNNKHRRQTYRESSSLDCSHRLIPVWVRV